MMMTPSPVVDECPTKYEASTNNAHKLEQSMDDVMVDGDKQVSMGIRVSLSCLMATQRFDDRVAFCFHFTLLLYHYIDQYESIYWDIS